MNFQIRKTFYPFPVYEFNLPAGHTRPFAKDCKTTVDRETGKFIAIGPIFRCYAAMSERFPEVRESRWKNFEEIIAGAEIILPPEAKHVRIHGSGDFFSQKYFDTWLKIAAKNPDVIFWAFTKSIGFWVNRLNDIPQNLTLNASKGSAEDHLISQYNLKYAEVFGRIEDVPEGMPIDTDDSRAMKGTESFALLNNNRYDKSFSKTYIKKQLTLFDIIKQSRGTE